MANDWAKDLDQRAFEAEYRKLNPRCDFIPSVADYTADAAPPPEDRLISGVKPDDYVPEEEPKKPETRDEKEEEMYVCKGCGRKFKYNIAMNRHQKFCKKALAKKF